MEKASIYAGATQAGADQLVRLILTSVYQAHVVGGTPAVITA